MTAEKQMAVARLRAYTTAVLGNTCSTFTAEEETGLLENLWLPDRTRVRLASGLHHRIIRRLQNSAD